MSTKSFEWVDLSKFTRLITFGCSFTDYRYPTWADIMARAMPQAEFINLGKGGAGNLYISNRVAKANRELTFTETDLIMIMWSTHCREDRFVNKRWLSPGNIYTQGEYPESFVKQFCDPLGYLIRDLSLIDLTNVYLDNLPCTHIGMLSVPFEYQQDLKNETTTEVLETYKEVIDYFPPSMFESEMNYNWTTNVVYEFNDKPMPDYHPTPLNYYNYLKSLGLELKDKALEYAAQSDMLLRTMKSIAQIRETWPDIDMSNKKDFW